MAASDDVPIFFKNRLHLAGRPQMSTRLNSEHSTFVGACDETKAENIDGAQP
ncbi:hypothetical protein ACT4MK_08005 [Bradyrhizobium barranii]|jgi:hypothetical protein|uniref:hypothetical protein n=1 Tax=Bradyrhizobium TaxID=374 RepID=UPI0033995E14